MSNNEETQPEQSQEGKSSAADALANQEEDPRFFKYSGPEKGVKYPREIIYCDVCDGWPLEYCEYHPEYEKAKEWMEDNLSDKLKAIYLSQKDDDKEGGGEKKRQTRGGKGIVRAKKKVEKERKICLARESRGKKKYTTVVTGLASYDIDLKAASKFFASRFSCGSSVTGEDEIVIQGDFKDDLFDILTEKWSEIDEDTIEDLGDQKRA